MRIGHRRARGMYITREMKGRIAEVLRNWPTREASADQVGPNLRAQGMLFPSQSDILETEVTTAIRVAEFMFDQSLAQVERPRDLRTWIEGQLYRPHY